MTFFQTESRGDTLVVTMDRAPVNALSIDMMEEGAKLLRQVAADKPKGGVVLTGANGVFTAGVDRTEVPEAETNAAHRIRLVGAVNQFAAAVHRIPTALVCAVGGHSIGAGGIVCLAADWTVVADVEAKIGLPEAGAGMPFPPVPQIILDYGLEPTWRRRLAFSSQMVGPHDALEIGLADEVVPPDVLLDAAVAVAQQMEAQPGFREVKKTFRRRAKLEIDAILAP